MDLSIVIPVYNSQNSIIELVNDIQEKIRTIKFEIILVDDRSKDESYQKCLELSSKFNNVYAIRLMRNYGQQNAILAGVRSSKGKYIVTMDDDRQHSPEDVMLLYEEILEGYDIVYGIDFDESTSSYRKLGSKMVAWSFNSIFHKDKDIRVSSFRIFNKKMKDVLVVYKGSFVYISAIMLSHYPRIKNIVIKKKQRMYGKSNYNLIKLVKLFINIHVYYSDNILFKLFRNKKEQYIIEVTHCEKNNDTRGI